MKDAHLFKDNYNLYLKQQMMLEGVTIRELAKETGYSYEGVRQILLGKGSYRSVFKVCKVLGVEMKKLLKEAAHSCNVCGEKKNVKTLITQELGSIPLCMNHYPKCHELIDD